VATIAGSISQVVPLVAGAAFIELSAGVSRAVLQFTIGTV
jgi:hypothetical protein